MNTKTWIYSIITYVVLTVGLILLFDYFWPDNKVISLIIPLVVGALITHFVRKIFDFIPDIFNRKGEKPFWGVLINLYSQKYTLIDKRENKLQPLEGNKHVDFTLRIMNHYYDVFASDVDKDIQKVYKIGKDTSILNGSKLIIRYKDSKHKAQDKTVVLE